MKTVTVSNLKASLSRHLRQVKEGEELFITEHGRPIAKVAPASGLDTLPVHLAEMQSQGLVRIGSGKLPRNFWKLPRPRTKGRVLQAVLEEREEGW